MPAGLPLPSSTENVSTTLSTGINAAASTMDVADSTGIVAPCYLVLDRVDSSGTLKTFSSWEYVKVTNVASNTLTITRGQNGSSAQSHSSGAVVEAVVTSAMFEDWHAALNPEHTASGGHVMGNATTTSLRVVTNINASGASVVGFGTGGFNALFQVPGGLASVANIGGLVPVPTSLNGNFINAYVTTPSSVASIGVYILKNFAVYGVCEILGGATFASSASIGTTALSAGDVLTLDIRSTASLAQNLSVLLRAS